MARASRIQDEIRDGVLEKVIRPTIPAHLRDDRTIYHINPVTPKPEGT